MARVSGKKSSAEGNHEPEITNRVNIINSMGAKRTGQTYDTNKL